MADLETPIGIIIPPTDIKNIVNKTAQFVARNGTDFEVRIRKNEANNPKFNFLKSDDPYNSFYRHRVAAYKTGAADEEAKKEAEEQAEKEEADRLAKEKEGIAGQNPNDKIGGAQSAFIPTEAPPKWEFIIDPPTLNARELDTLKLTAQFVAKNGKSFLTDLMHREAKNYHFDFLRPQHSLFPFFSKMVEQYTKVIIPSRALLNTIERDALPAHRGLGDYKKDLNYRIDWTRHQRRKKEQQEEAEEKDKEQYNQIDWHDFVIVETVDYEQTEALTALGNFPNPVTIEELGKRLTQQIRFEEFGEEGIKQQLADEQAQMELEQKRQTEMAEARKLAEEAEREADALAEREAEERHQRDEDERLAKQRAAAAMAALDRPKMITDDDEDDNMEMEMDQYEGGGEEAQEEDDDEDPTANIPAPSFINPNNIKIVKNYDPKQKEIMKSNAAKLLDKGLAEKWLTSPLTGEKIPAHKMEDHMRHGLLDPNFIESKKRQVVEKQHAGGIYAQNKDIGRSLSKMAQRRTDIFGVEETFVGKKITESDRDVEVRKNALRTWDGHAGSAELVTARAKKVSVHQQIQDLKKVDTDLASGKDLNELNRAAASIGPRTGGTFIDNSTTSSAAQSGGRKQPPPPPSERDLIANPMLASYEQVPHTVLSPHILTQKLPSGKPNKRSEPLIPKSFEEKLLEAGGIDNEENPVMLAEKDFHKEAQYAGLSEIKRARMDPNSKLLPEHAFIHKYNPENTPCRFFVQCPDHDGPWDLRNQKIDFQLRLTDTVLKVKEIIEQNTGMPAGKQKLQYDGAFMKDHLSLAASNVCPDTVIKVTVKERGGKKK